jgi:hypothetical protein
MEKTEQTRTAAPTKADLAKLICKMSYGELRDVGLALHNMSKPDGEEIYWDLTNDGDWSAMIHAWAESVSSED